MANLLAYVQEEIASGSLQGLGALVLSAAAVWGGSKIPASLRARARTQELAENARRKRAARDDKRAAVKAQDWASMVAAFEAGGSAAPAVGPVEIITMSATQLLEAMGSGRLSSEQVTRALCARAKLCGEELNTNAEEFFDEAIDDAIACDMERARGELRGPLHGLPISVKDQYHMRGADSTCGLSVRCFKPSPEDGLLVSLARTMGAIPFVRTNVPQCLMLPESFNAIWGTACNPFDRTRAVGGSSGGEGGLIAARGSPLGLGTDIGGSIRIPAHMCGIFGFKPTPQRMTAKGLAVPRPRDMNGQNAVKSAPGPLARCVEDCELLMQVWCREKMWTVDKTIPPQPWDRAEYLSERKLKFGYFASDGFFDPAPACGRAVTLTVDALRAQGHTVVEFDNSELYECALLFVGLLAAEGKMQGFVAGLEGEPLHPYYAYLFKISQTPNVLRPLISAVLRHVLGQPRVADLVCSANMKDTKQYWETVAQRDALKARVIAQWEGLEIDALICPGLGVPAFRHGDSEKLNQACSYTYIWNNLHFPAGTVPVTEVGADETEYKSGFKDDFSAKAKEACLGSAGMPVGVQVVALPWRDELCLGAMRAVQQAVGWRIKEPRTLPYLPTPASLREMRALNHQEARL